MKKIQIPKDIKISLIVASIIFIALIGGLSIKNKMVNKQKENTQIEQVLDNEFETIDKMNFDAITKLNNGKKTKIVYGATWCPTCQEEFLALNKIDFEKENENLVIVMYPFIWDNGVPKDYLKETKEFIKNNDLKYKIYLDLKGFVYEKYQIKQIPFMTIID